MNTQNQFRPALENLEGRDVMAASLDLLPNGTLLINCEGATDDVVQIRQTSTQIVLNGKVAYSSAKVSGIIVYGNAGNDTLDADGVAKPVSLYGGSGNDRLVGGNNADLIRGGADHDLIFGGAGNDELHGDGGNDRIFAGDGYDQLFGEAGTDFLDDGRRGANEFYDTGDGADFIADIWAVDGVRVDDVVQGQTGSCSFLAGLAAGVDAGIDYSQWISYRGYNSAGQGIYDVKLWNPGQGRYFQQQVLFDGSTNQYDTGTAVNKPGRVAEFESWVLLMQRAYLNAGGNTSPSFALAAATGGSATHVNMTDRDAQGTLIRALNANRPVTAAIGNSVFYGISGHAMTVVAARGTTANMEVLIYNPWGMDAQTASGKPGAIQGSATDGYFWISWGMFRSYFDSGFWVR